MLLCGHPNQRQQRIHQRRKECLASSAAIACFPHALPSASLMRPGTFHLTYAKNPRGHCATLSFGNNDSFPPEEAWQAIQKEVQQRRPVLTCIKRCVERDIPVYGKDDLDASSVSSNETTSEKSETETELDE